MPQGTILGPTSFPSTFPLVNDKYDNTRSLQDIVNMRLIGKLAYREQLNLFYATGALEPLMLLLSYCVQQQKKSKTSLSVEYSCVKLTCLTLRHY